MSLRLTVLGSGSSGNCALLQSAEATVLIDVGFSARNLRQLLRHHGLDLGAVQAVFLTHEHGDHTAGLPALERHPEIEVFANAATQRALGAKCGDFRPAWRTFETGSRFTFRDLQVASFSVPHDAQEPVGFTFATGQPGDLVRPPCCLAWITDLGHAPRHLHEHLRAADVVALESNYCPRLLEADFKRPWALKQRFAGRHGHLANEAARDLLAEVASPRWRRILLTHVSQECNSVAAIEATMAALKLQLGCTFTIVPPGGGTPCLPLDA